MECRDYWLSLGLCYEREEHFCRKGSGWGMHFSPHLLRQQGTTPWAIGRGDCPDPPQPKVPLAGQAGQKHTTSQLTGPEALGIEGRLWEGLPGGKVFFLVS